ncbi:hypothetical protein MMC28_008113 [Mycoblastus sanguinarius]|nr:hypothetical protein [Mycoblastus sanguinarius]
MASQFGRGWTEGSYLFNPDALFESWGSGQRTLPEDNDLRSSVISTFKLPHNDSYVYHATASVTLAQVQAAINHGGESGLHAWYLDSDGTRLAPPPTTDSIAYTSIFAANTAPSKVLTGFAANAKKGSIRSKVTAYLQSQRVIPSTFSIPKSKKHINPYYDYWSWSCQSLEWCGPEDGTENVKTSHHILPVFMHHFGCVVPSYEALEVIKQIGGKGKRPVVEMGSGNGYWTYMLRRLGVEVIAVDNEQSQWRTMWIGDTVIKGGEQYLAEGKGSKDAVLLMVYPIVGAGFTAKILEAYKGDTVAVAGTQNRSGYTAFKDQTVGEYMFAERKGFEKTVQIPLPSFAGKDEALFVFERKLGGDD